MLKSKHIVNSYSHLPSSNLFDFAGRSLDLSLPHVMGILNVTPDSFSDGGELLHDDNAGISIEKALGRAESMLLAGAAIIDVGGESTRPGAEIVSSQEEMDRVLPVVEAIAKNLDVIISVDTSNPAVIDCCEDLGVGLINDVRALNRPGALAAVAKTKLPVCLMHMQGQPDMMQDQPAYNGIIEEIISFFNNRVQACEAAGIGRDRVLLDPGFGFGKTLAHNVELLNRIDTLLKIDLPLLIGLSRKRMIGALTEKIEKDRMAGSLAAAVIGVLKGARIIRTHDVAETVDAMKVCSQVL